MLGLMRKSKPKEQDDLGEGRIETVVYQNQKWRVRFAGSSWNGTSEETVTLLPGDAVRVVKMENITLIIKPISSK
jgi:membrane protein implicated in regulation of membrane protease activity